MHCLAALPCCRTQSIEGFLVSQASAAALATAAAGGAKRRRSSALAGGSSGSRAGLAGPGPDAAGEAAGDVFGADGLFSNASLHLQAAAAEEAAAAAELASAEAAAPSDGLQGAGPLADAQLQRLQQQEALLRPVAQPRLPAVVTNLSSIWELLGEVQDNVHAELQQLFKGHTWVGMVSTAATHTSGTKSAARHQACVSSSRRPCLAGCCESQASRWLRPVQSMTGCPCLPASAADYAAVCAPARAYVCTRVLAVRCL